MADLKAVVAHCVDGAALLRLGDEEAGAGRWEEAALFFRAVERQALVLLGAGDRAGHRRLCEQLLRVAREAGPRLSPDAANAVARLCALAPEAVTDWEQPLALSRAALDALGRTKASAQAKAQVRHARLNTLGAVLYRAGRHKEALARLQEGLKEHGSGGIIEDWLLLALVQHRLGNVAEAQRRLAQARAWLAHPPNDLDWQRGLTVRLLLAEVQDLLES